MLDPFAIESAEKAKSRDELLAETPAEIRQEAEAMLENPALLRSVVSDLRMLGVAGEQELAETLFLVAVSRLLSKPLSAIVQGPSSSGKSYVAEKVASLLPPEAVLQATAMTDNALYYMPEGALKHRLVLAGERRRRQDDQTATATKALRELISSGRLSKAVVMSDPVTREPETRLVEQEGPIAYIESTTLTKVFEEDANRCLLLQTDDRSEQTELILGGQARRAARPDKLEVRKHIVEVHHTIQRLIEQLPVVVPFAESLCHHFPCEQVESRRAFTQFLGMIEASALMHQRQREYTEGYVVASEDDYSLVRRLLRRPLARMLGGDLPDSIKRFYYGLRQARLSVFTASEAHKLLKVSDHTVRDYLHALQDVGAVDLVEEHRGRKAAKWSLVDGFDFNRSVGTFLPPFEELDVMSELAENQAASDKSAVPF